MTNQDLANFYGISAQAVGRWSVEKRKQKTVQALANAEQPIVDLIADISKLSYIYDCQWLHGVEQKRWCWIHRTPKLFACYLYIKGEEADFENKIAFMDRHDVVDQLQSIKTRLEELVYGL